MTKSGKYLVSLAAIAGLCLLATPISTEWRIQSAIRHLEKNSLVSECIAEFGKPSRKANEELKAVLVERLSLKVSAGDEIVIFQREGIPYWAIYLVTPDGETITDFAVDRFW